MDKLNDVCPVPRKMYDTEFSYTGMLKNWHNVWNTLETLIPAENLS
jgi:hypothetical protein